MLSSLYFLILFNYHFILCNSYTSFFKDQNLIVRLEFYLDHGAPLNIRPIEQTIH